MRMHMGGSRRFVKVSRGARSTAVAMALVVVVGGCGDSEEPAKGATDNGAATEQNGAAGPFTIGAMTVVTSPLNAVFTQGFNESKGQEDEIVQVDAGGDIAKESELFQNFISRDVDAIMVQAQNATGSAASFKRAKQAGIPIFCWNTCLTPELQKQYVTGFVASDDEKLGKTTGDAASAFIKEKLGGSANIVMVHCTSLDPCKLRQKGFLGALDAAGVKYKVLARQEAVVADKAAPLANAMLTANPSTNIVFAQNDGAVVGAVNAVKTRKLGDEVKVFGVDGGSVISEMLRAPDEILQFTTAQDLKGQANQVMKMTLAHLKTGKAPSPALARSGQFALAHGDTAAIDAYDQNELPQ